MTKTINTKMDSTKTNSKYGTIENYLMTCPCCGKEIYYLIMLTPTSVVIAIDGCDYGDYVALGLEETIELFCPKCRQHVCETKEGILYKGTNSWLMQH